MVFQQPRTNRRVIAALMLASATLCGCERKAEPRQAPPSSEPKPAAAPPAALLPPPPMGRSELLSALEEARAAYAAGESAPEQKLAGRRFSVRQAFACGGPPAAQAEDGVAHWTWAPKSEGIELSLTPSDLTPTLATPTEDTQWEAAEGYWLTRPWLRSDDCPAAHAPPPSNHLQAIAAPTPRWTDGLAAVFERGGSRVGRREGKAFSLVVRDEAHMGVPPKGYRLLIEGRFSSFPDGRAIRCQSANPDSRPLCIAASVVDRVAIEDADGNSLAEWRLG